jgi:predicted Ser/Thr protein kinase
MDTYIMEGLVILHETIHEIHHKKLPRVILIIDFEKAYNKVNRDSLPNDADQRV